MNDVDKKLTEHEARIQVLEDNVTDLKNVTNELHSLAISVERISTNQTIMLQQQQELKNDVDELKTQPAKEAREIRMTVIKEALKYIVVLLLGGLVAWIIRGGVQGWI